VRKKELCLSGCKHGDGEAYDCEKCVRTAREKMLSGKYFLCSDCKTVFNEHGVRFRTLKEEDVPKKAKAATRRKIVVEDGYRYCKRHKKEFPEDEFCGTCKNNIIDLLGDCESCSDSKIKFELKRDWCICIRHLSLWSSKKGEWLWSESVLKSATDFPIFTESMADEIRRLCLHEKIITLPTKTKKVAGRKLILGRV
jgi:hypothetical protein